MKAGGTSILLLDCGDFIGREGRQPEKNSIQLKIAAEFLLEAMDWMGYTAANVGEGDLIFGDAFLKEIADGLGVSVVSASVYAGGEVVFPEVAVTSIGGVRAGIVGLLGDRFAPYVYEHSNPGRPLEIIATAQAARRGLELLRDEVDLRILLAHAPIADVRVLLEDVSGYDVVISGHDTNDVVIVDPEVISNARLIQTGWDGQYIGRLDLTFNREGAITVASGSAVAMDDGFPPHPHMETLHERYLERVAEAIEEILEAYPVKAPPTGGSYVGWRECKGCHASEAESWKTTKHAQAWETLRDRHRDYDPECFSCHTTGFQFEGGFRLITETPLMADAQCETCHGAGADHCAEPTLPYGRPDEAACTQCHVPLHSPDFDYETYLPQILHTSQP